MTQNWLQILLVSLTEVLKGNASINHKSRTRTSFDFCKLHTEAI